MEEESIANFCQIYDFKNVINYPKCYKIPENLTCIDLIMINKPKWFQNFIPIETGPSHFHKWQQ